MNNAKGKYNQWRAMLAIAKASLKSIFRSPSAVIFSFLFPIIFILVFGFLSSTTPVIRVTFDPASSNANELYTKLLEKSNLKVISQPLLISRQELEKGHITAIIKIREINPAAYPKYAVEITTSTAAADRIGLLQSIIQQAIAELDLVNFPQRPSYAYMQKETLPGREYRTIDFILPGQLGFSLLSAGVFGVAFIFFSLRQTLVLKRFFATPIKRTYIVFGEGLEGLRFR